MKSAKTRKPQSKESRNPKKQGHMKDFDLILHVMRNGSVKQKAELNKILMAV
jgi:hypothetical protein